MADDWGRVCCRLRSVLQRACVTSPAEAGTPCGCRDVRKGRNERAAKRNDLCSPSCSSHPACVVGNGRSAGLFLPVAREPPETRRRLAGAVHDARCDAGGWTRCRRVPARSRCSAASSGPLEGAGAFEKVLRSDATDTSAMLCLERPLRTSTRSMNSGDRSRPTPHPRPPRTRPCLPTYLE
jgi:hypothetical protein